MHKSSLRFLAATARRSYPSSPSRTMSSLTFPIPIVVCGRAATVGKPVSEALKPEFEAGFDTASSYIASTLAGQKPQTPVAGDFGTHNFDRPPRAVFLGRAFDTEQAKELMQVADGSNKEPVAWLVASTPPPKVAPPSDYAQQVGQLTKEILLKWVNEGAKTNGIIYY